MHGGPGVGKSKVLLLLKDLFTDVCGWQMWLEYQMGALQAVMAEQLGGDTLHHACGINKFAPCNEGAAKESQKQTKVAERVLQWRWLIFDEVSMISPQLLAELDMKLRDVVRRLCPTKQDASGHDRAFGGINVLFAGDFWQLDPPSGGCLISIPVEYIRNARQYVAKPTVAHGQAIFWHKGLGAVQGVTELTKPFAPKTRGSWKCNSRCALAPCLKTIGTFWTVAQPRCLAAGSTELASAAMRLARNSRARRLTGKSSAPYAKNIGETGTGS